MMVSSEFDIWKEVAVHHVMWYCLWVWSSW